MQRLSLRAIDVPVNCARGEVAVLSVECHLQFNPSD